MNRKEFLVTPTMPFVAPCKHQRPEVLAQRPTLLEADLNTELLQISSFNANTSVGL